MMNIIRIKKSYIKATTLRGLTFEGFGHVTCNVEIGGRDLYETIMQGLKAVVDNCLNRTSS